MIRAYTVFYDTLLAMRRAVLSARGIYLVGCWQIPGRAAATAVAARVVELDAGETIAPSTLMDRQQLLQSIAGTIADYRRGEIPVPDAEHVDRWARQFDVGVQEPVLAEMDHVLRHCYLSRGHVMSFLRELVSRKQLLRPNSLEAKLRNALGRVLSRICGARHFPGQWRNARLLEIQHHGASQVEMVRLLRELLDRQYRSGTVLRSSTSGPFVYLDDILFTGTRIIIDLHEWLETSAPQQTDVVVIVLACYRHGLMWAHRALMRAAAATGKRLRLHWIRLVDLENRRWTAIGRECFHPASLPDDPIVHAYADELANGGQVPPLRTSDANQPSRIFASERGRHLLEQQLLLAGLKIRAACNNVHHALRPLGYDVVPGFGFGATLVTYRNCPNNCPLAWWWGMQSGRDSSPWYPLFPRRF